MPAAAAYAPGKIILFGEHAVVYGRPAIAVPVTQVRAKATVFADPSGPEGRVQIEAPDIGLHTSLDELPSDHPFALAVNGVKDTLQIIHLPALRLRVTSTIPIASGLGSGAAVSAAVARALSGFLGMPLADEQVSAIAYRVDQKHHGNPSGIDNTVIAYAQPVFFVRGQPFERILVHQPFTIVIGNSGVSSPTREAVASVRALWQADPETYERVFDSIGAVARLARQYIEQGQPEQLGPLMTENHALLQTLTVSSPELDSLVETALRAGALGAKLCGAGRGGNMLALVTPDTAERVAAALRAAGAVNSITTVIGSRT